MDLESHLDINCYHQMELHHSTRLIADFSFSYIDTLQHQLQNRITKVLIQIIVLCKNCACLDIGGKMDDHIHRIHTEDTSCEEASFVEDKDTDTDTFQDASSEAEDNSTSVKVVAMSITDSHFFYYSLKQAVAF